VSPPAGALEEKGEQVNTYVDAANTRDSSAAGSYPGARQPRHGNGGVSREDSLSAPRTASSRVAPSFGIVAAIVVVFMAALAVCAPPALAAASVASIEPASKVGVTSAEATGTVNGEDHDTSFHFEWVTQAQFEAEGFAAAEPNGQVGGFSTAFAGAGPVPAEAQLFSLAPGTTYHLRLVAENSEGEKAEAIAPTFATKAATPPTLTAHPATGVGYTIATLHGEVDPEGGNENPLGPEIFPIVWYLQYGPVDESTHEVEFWENAQVPSNVIEGAEATEDFNPGEGIAIEATLAPGTLQPGREYATRVFAEWLGGARTAESPQPYETFETETAVAPTVTIEAPTAVSDHSAHFSGTVNPNAPEEEALLSEDAKAAFRTTWHFECQPACPGVEGTVEADNSSEPVGGEAALEPNTEYTVKLVATNGGGKGEATEIAGQPVTFKTGALQPGVAIGTNTPDPNNGQHEVLLRGYVDPHNSPVTACAFEIGPAAGSYDRSVPCDSSPSGGNEPVEVKIGRAHV